MSKSELTDAMERVLENIHAGLSPDHGFHGRSAHGGLAGTLSALKRRGLIDHEYRLTQTGIVAIRPGTILEQDLKNAAAKQRLFSGVYPTGIVYADRNREVSGDYARLAFLSFSTLTLEVEKNCPKELRPLIEADAASIQARRGEAYQVSEAGQTITLGYALRTP